MELWDLYTKDRIKASKTMVRGEQCPTDYYRLVVHICIFNDQGQMLIQHRQPFKYGWSNMWDITVGGSAIAGDTSQSAAERELFEELGIKMSLAMIRPAFTINFEHGFDDFYLVESNVELNQIKLQYEEVESVRWASHDEIMEMIQEGTFIPYEPSLIDLLFYFRNHKHSTTKKDTTSPS